MSCILIKKAVTSIERRDTSERRKHPEGEAHAAIAQLLLSLPTHVSYMYHIHVSICWRCYLCEGNATP